MIKYLILNSILILFISLGEIHNPDPFNSLDKNIIEAECFDEDLSPTLQGWWTPDYGTICFAECTRGTICCFLVPAPVLE